MKYTNFYKLPIPDLVKRIDTLQSWLNDNPGHKRKSEVYEILVKATQMHEARKAVKEDPKGNRLLADALDVFWGDVPLQYEPGEEVKPRPIEEELFEQERPEQKTLPV